MPLAMAGGSGSKRCGCTPHWDGGLDQGSARPGEPGADGIVSDPSFSIRAPRGAAVARLPVRVTNASTTIVCGGLALGSVHCRGSSPNTIAKAAITNSPAASAGARRLILSALQRPRW
jgi:hypothetical protein